MLQKQFDQRRAQRETHARDRQVARQVHLQELHERHLRFLRELAALELQQLQSSEKTAAKALKRRHLAELRRQPRELRKKEDQIRRSYNETVKSQQRQLKTLSKMLDQTKSKAGGPTDPVLLQRAEEQEEKLARLKEQYRTSLMEVSSIAEESLARRHKAEWEAHDTTYGQAMSDLQAYQRAREQAADENHQLERENLGNEIEAALQARQAEVEAEARQLKVEQQRMVLLKATHAQQLANLAESRRRHEASLRLLGAGGGGGDDLESQAV